MRSKIISYVLLLISCDSSSQKLLFKEYKTSGYTEEQYITMFCGGNQEKFNCRLSNIWKFENNSFFSISGKSVLIFNSSCQEIDSITFSKNIIDISVREKLMIVSVTDDEVEYYESNILITNLEDKSITELPVDRLGVKFGLNISNNGQYLSYIHQDADNSSQNLVLFDMKNNTLVQIERTNINENSFGGVGFPAKTYWVNNNLYYVMYSKDYESKFIFKYNYAKSLKTKVVRLSPEHSLIFRINVNEDQIILLKRNNHKYDRIISLNINNGNEEVLYVSGSTLSDLDDFTFIDKSTSKR